MRFEENNNNNNKEKLLKLCNKQASKQTIVQYLHSAGIQMTWNGTSEQGTDDLWIQKQIYIFLEL